MAENEYNRNEEEDLSQVAETAEGQVNEGAQNLKKIVNATKNPKSKKDKSEGEESEQDGSKGESETDSGAGAGEEAGNGSDSNSKDSSTDENEDSNKENKNGSENSTDTTEKEIGTDENKGSSPGENNAPGGEQNTDLGNAPSKAGDGTGQNAEMDGGGRQKDVEGNTLDNAGNDGLETNQSTKNLSNNGDAQHAEKGNNSKEGKGKRSLQDKKTGGAEEANKAGKSASKESGKKAAKQGSKTASKGGKETAKKASKKSEEAAEGAEKAAKKFWSWLTATFGAWAIVIVLVLVFLLLFIAIIIGAFGAFASNNSSGGAGSGAPLSGSAAHRLIQIAHQEKGTLQSGSDKYVLPMGGTSGDPWCSYYAGWLLKQVGVDVDSVGWSATVTSWTAELKSKNLFHLRGTYTPHTGDAIIYGEDTHHVGIVLEAKDGKVYTTEGNTWGDISSSMVWEHEFSLDDTRIYGYGEIRVSTASTGSGGGSGNFTPRLTCPESNDRHYFSNENIFYASGFGMPNCTAYAYGRAYELMGTTPDLSPKSAQYWFDYNKENHIYEYGSEPRLGAILCMERAGGGHVAVVEKIEPDGTITTSESAWNGTMFYTLTRQKGYYQYDDRYTVQGFIYIPVAGGSNQGFSSMFTGNTQSGQSGTSGGNTDTMNVFSGFISAVKSMFGFGGSSTGRSFAGGGEVALSSVAPDPNYKSPTFRNWAGRDLTAAERAHLEDIITGEFCESEVGSILIAQCIRDALVYGDEICPDLGDNVLKVASRLGYDGFSGTGQTCENAKNAVRYVFDEGNCGVKHRILLMYNPELQSSSWHEERRYVLTFESVRFFDLWDGEHL